MEFIVPVMLFLLVLALVALMDAMNITPDTPLMITLSEGKMVVVPANVGFSNEEIDDFFDEIRPKYNRMLENLAK